MAALVLVKHSLPDVDPATPPDSWSLNDTGRRRCRRLASLLLPYAPAAIASSPEPKARETAALIAGRLGGDVALDRDLREQEREAIGWLGDVAFRKAVHAAMAWPFEAVLGMEPLDSARSRFGAAVENLTRRHAPGSLVVVAHGTVISAYAASLLGVPMPELWQMLGMPSFVALSLPELTPLVIVGEIDDGPYTDSG